MVKYNNSPSTYKLTSRKDDYFTPKQLINIFKNNLSNFKPGEEFEYSNSNYIILGYIIEKVSNMSYENFVRNNIFIPLDMKNSGYDHKCGSAYVDIKKLEDIMRGNSYTITKSNVCI